MSSEPKSGLAARVERFPGWAGACVMAIGLLVLVGWQGNLELLKRVAPRMVSMNPLTAVGFVLCGAAIFFSQRRFSEDPVKARAGQIFAGLTLVLAGLKICDTLGQWHLGIDKVLFRSKLDLEVAQNGGGPPSSLALNSAINFIASSLALLILDNRAGARNRLAQYLAILVLIVSWVAVIGYSYGTAALYVVQAYKPMALHSAFAGFFIGAGILCLRPESGPMALVIPFPLRNCMMVNGTA